MEDEVKAALDEDFQAEVAPAFGPFIGLFGQAGSDKPDDRFSVGKLVKVRMSARAALR